VIDVDALFREHHEALVRFLLRRCNGDRALAEELAQETWLRVHRRAGSYTDRGVSVLAWLFTIARNLHIDTHRQRRLVQTLSLDQVSERAAMTRDAGSDTQMTRLDLARLLGKLTPKQRATIEARFLQGMTALQASEAIGITEDGVKKQQARALVNLKRMLEREAA
jgi:RNA polymerase sigma-70 factor (ECF subfamily)